MKDRPDSVSFLTHFDKNPRCGNQMAVRKPGRGNPVPPFSSLNCD